MEKNKEKNKENIYEAKRAYAKAYLLQKKYRNTYKVAVMYEKENNWPRFFEYLKKCKAELEKVFVVSYNDEDYDNLFNSGGKLYPLQLEELIPVDSQMNNKSCQVCYPSSVIIDSIPGYVKSTYVIYEKNKDYYDITMIMRQLDNKTGILLNQYCNTKIYII